MEDEDRCVVDLGFDCGTVVKASDGNLYDLEALQEWMNTDPWHTSPCTREVLRPVVVVVRSETGVLEVPPLFTDVAATDSIDTDLPPKGRIVVWSLPTLIDPEHVGLRTRWQLPTCSVTLAARTLFNDGLYTVMHPPPEARDTGILIAELAKAFGAVSVVNPECLTTAQLRWVAHDGTVVQTTVEAQARRMR